MGINGGASAGARAGEAWSKACRQASHLLGAFEELERASGAVGVAVGEGWDLADHRDAIGRLQVARDALNVEIGRLQAHMMYVPRTQRRG